MYTSSVSTRSALGNTDPVLLERRRTNTSHKSYTCNPRCKFLSVTNWPTWSQTALNLLYPPTTVVQCFDVVLKCIDAAQWQKNCPPNKSDGSHVPSLHLPTALASFIRATGTQLVCYFSIPCRQFFSRVGSRLFMDHSWLRPFQLSGVLRMSA